MACPYDRRELERFSLDASTNIHLLDPYTTDEQCLPNQTFQAQTRDISAKGAYVYVKPAIEKGTPVHVEMHLVIDSLPELLNVPKDVRIRVDGRIARQDRDGVGILFNVELRFDQPTRPPKYNYCGN